MCLCLLLEAVPKVVVKCRKVYSLCQRDNKESVGPVSREGRCISIPKRSYSSMSLFNGACYVGSSDATVEGGPSKGRSLMGTHAVCLRGYWAEQCSTAPKSEGSTYVSVAEEVQ